MNAAAGYSDSGEVLDLEAQDFERAEAERLLDFEESMHRDDLRFIMSHPQGRRYVWRILDRAGMWRASFTGDRNSTDFREGERNVALWLWSELQELDEPRLMDRMIQEARSQA